MGVSDFLLSKNYQGVLSIAEVCNLDYLYHTTLNVSIICHHNLFVYHCAAVVFIFWMVVSSKPYTVNGLTG